MKFNYEHDYPINIQNLYDTETHSLTPQIEPKLGRSRLLECGKKHSLSLRSIRSVGVRERKNFVFNSVFGHVTRRRAQQQQRWSRWQELVNTI